MHSREDAVHKSFSFMIVIQTKIKAQFYVSKIEIGKTGNQVVRVKASKSRREPNG